MPYADNNGVRIYYQVEGDGSPLVLQHGFTQSMRRWYLHGYVDALKSATNSSLSMPVVMDKAINPTISIFLPRPTLM